MTEEESSMYPTMGLDIIVLDELKKGSIVTSPIPYEEQQKEVIHYKIKAMRDTIKEIYDAYSNNKSKDEIFKIIEKNHKKMDDSIDNFMDRIEHLSKKEKILKVIEKKTNSKGEITIKFKEVSMKEKASVVQSIVKKLASKVTKKQLEVMFEQSIMKLNDMDVLKKVDKALDKKKPKIKDNRGCFKLIIEDTDLMIIN